MDVIVLWILVARTFWLDAECVGAKVVALGLEEVGGQVLAPVAVVEAQCGAEGWRGNSPERTLGHNVSPPGLGAVDGLGEEIVEEEVLKIGVVAVGVGNVLEEDRSDDAPTTPHEGDGGLVQLPSVFFRSLD